MNIPTIVIPTYWTRAGGKQKPTDTYFDHPTPLDGTETLTRALASLKIIKQKFNVIVVTASVDHKDEALNSDVVKRVQSIIDNFKPDYPIMQFCYKDLKVIHSYLKKLGLEDVVPDINLNSYPNIRNCQLIVPHVLGSDVMMGIDDDEVVSDENFVARATELIGKNFKGKTIYGVSGFYQNKEGYHFVKNMQKPSVKNIFFEKWYWKNEVFKIIDKDKGRYVKSPVVFGGNMVVHRKMFEKVSYDPFIRRGENMDYLINAKMDGFDFYMDKNLFITHLPPEIWDKKFERGGFNDTGAFSKSNYHKFQQDVIRFIYEKEKIRLANEEYKELKNVSLEELNPYPGKFFTRDLNKEALFAYENLYKDEVKKDEIPPKERIREAITHAKDLAPRYFKFRLQWIKMMAKIKGHKALKEYFQGKF